MDCKGCARRQQKLRQLRFRLGLAAEILATERTAPWKAYKAVKVMEATAARAWDEAVAHAATGEEASWA